MVIDRCNYDDLFLLDSYLFSCNWPHYTNLDGSDFCNTLLRTPAQKNIDGVSPSLLLGLQQRYVLYILRIKHKKCFWEAIFVTLHQYYGLNNPKALNLCHGIHQKFRFMMYTFVSEM
jgi:hypothetical protein